MLCPTEKIKMLSQCYGSPNLCVQRKAQHSAHYCDEFFRIWLNPMEGAVCSLQVQSITVDTWYNEILKWKDEKKRGTHSMQGTSCLPKTCINAINTCVFPKFYNRISNSSINAGLAGLARGVQIKFKKKKKKKRTLNTKKIWAFVSENEDRSRPGCFSF